MIWPATLPELGTRTVGAFTDCADCAGDPPPDERVTVAGETGTVPGRRGTFARYGALPLCHRHATHRAAAAFLADVLDLFDGVIVERRPR